MKKVLLFFGIYFLNSFICASSTISLFNSTSAYISVGTNPAGMAITSDGAYAYIVNTGSDTVSVINLTTNVVIKTITGFDKPNFIIINPDGTKAYVTNSKYGGANTVSIIDINSSHTTTYNTIIATISGFDAPNGMAITKDGLFGYVTNYGDPTNIFLAGNSVSYVDLTTNMIISSIGVGFYPATVAMTSSNYLYVANYNLGTATTGSVSVIDINPAHALLSVPTFNTVIKTITGFFGPKQIAITPNGLLAYVTNFGNNISSNSSFFGQTVSVIDVNPDSSTFNTILDSIVVGSQPLGIAINPSGNYAFVTLYNQGGFGSLVTIQLSDNTVLTPNYTLAKGPNSIAIAPNGLYAYVSNYNSNSISVLSFANTFVVSVFNLSSSIFLYISNMFTNTLLQTIGYLRSNTTLTSTQYSAYSLFSQILQTPGCQGLNPFNLPNCGNTPVNVRVFVNGGTNNSNFYFDIPYSTMMSSNSTSSIWSFGPVTLNIDFEACVNQISSNQSCSAELITTAGLTSITGVQYSLMPNPATFNS